MEWLVFIGILAVVMGALGAWIAVQKCRVSSEGFILGFLFGPLGVLIEALLPKGSGQVDSVRGTSRRNIDEEGIIASIADRFRSALEEADPAWEKLSYHRQRGLLKPVEKQILKDLKLTPTNFSDYAAEARRLVLKGGARMN